MHFLRGRGLSRNTWSLDTLSPVTWCLVDCTSYYYLSLAVARERNVFIMWLNSAGFLRAQSTPLTQKPNVIRNIKSSKTISCSIFPSSIWGSYSFLSPSRFMAWTSCDPITSSIKMKNNTGKMSCRTNSRYKHGSILMKCKRKVEITWLNGKRNLASRVFLICSWVFQV